MGITHFQTRSRIALKSERQFLTGPGQREFWCVSRTQADGGLDTFRLSPFTLPRKREVAETSPETPFSVMKERQESSGKVILMREAFRGTAVHSHSGNFHIPPTQRTVPPACGWKIPTVLNEVSRYMYVPTNPPTTSRIRMQRPIRETLVFQGGLFVVLVFITIRAAAFFHTDDLEPSGRTTTSLLRSTPWESESCSWRMMFPAPWGSSIRIAVFHRLDFLKVTQRH